MSFQVGSLVQARGREWVVLPDSSDELLLLRPLGGGDDEVAGVLTALESVEPARFALPDPARLGDHRSAQLLRDALRLGFRSSAGPFRSFGRIAVEPRPYQLVPLLMALRQNPVRLLIADDVGIGKTIEAGLIARELLEQGEIERLCVLCPPHLAEQWQTELSRKFHIDAQLVLPSTASRLERDCRIDQTLFDLHRFVIVSMDYIKSERRRGDFVRTCPELVIIDEAHTCAEDNDAHGPGGRQQRHQLAAALAAKPDRHVLLVTATPHSGKPGAFRSLLSLLDPEFTQFPDDLSGPQNEDYRRQLARCFVQRRRKDIEHFLHADTPFPARKEAEEKYALTPAWRSLSARVLAYAREEVIDPEGHGHRQRVRWWSALALLRALSSSPAAAAATLRTRASTADTSTVEEADAVGRRAVLDLGDTEEAESLDVNPGADWSSPESETDPAQRLRRRLNELAREAEALKGEQDPKLLHAVRFLTRLTGDGYRPIVFCRFIATAEYLAEELRRRLPKGTEVIAVTGSTPASEREARIAELARPEHPRRVLVATDCLSEGINLQEHFDAVVHYDLSWNPTRHEQREGRVDRYGQANPEVRIVTYYSLDNQVDPIVLDVLVRKHKKIRTALGVSIPVPGDPNDLMQALVEGILRRPTNAPAEQLGFDAFLKPQQQEMLLAWESVAEREKHTRSMFAQLSIKVDEVERELAAVRQAVGTGTDVRSFVKEALVAHHGAAVEVPGGALQLLLDEAPPSLRDALALGGRSELQVRFELPVAEGQMLLTRTHPVVSGLASYVLDAALDGLRDGAGRRCGAIRTDAVAKRTTLLLVRYRFDLVTRRDSATHTLLAEDCGLHAFTGSPKEPVWLDRAEAEQLLLAAPTGNISAEQAREFVTEVVDHFPAHLIGPLEAQADLRAAELGETHRRVRQGARHTGLRVSVKPHRPPDVLGIYVYLPAPRLQTGGR